MRQADINRVNKAKEHLKAAVNLINGIRWDLTEQGDENMLTMVTKMSFCNKSRDLIKSADSYLTDVINMQAR